MRKMIAVAALATMSLAFAAPVMADKCPTPEEISAAFTAAKKLVAKRTEAENQEILGAIKEVKAGLPDLTQGQKKEIGQAIHDAKTNTKGGIGRLGGCQNCAAAASRL